MTTLPFVTAVTVENGLTKIEDALIFGESNGIYEVVVKDGPYKAVAAPKMGPTALTLTGKVAADDLKEVELILKALKIHSEDLPKSEAKKFISGLGHGNIATARVSESDVIKYIGYLISQDASVLDEVMTMFSHNVNTSSQIENAEVINIESTKAVSAEDAELLDSALTDAMSKAFGQCK